MIGLASDKDNSYFSVGTDDPGIAASINPDHVLSLTVHEEAEKIPSGNIQLLDQNGVYSKILRRNVPITVRWGYKKTNADVLDGGGTDFFSAGVDRRGFKAIIQDVSGEANDHGVYTFNASFMCRDFKGIDESKLYGVGGGFTKALVILAVFSELGVAAEVNFQGMDDAIPPDGERRDETPFRYLARKSKEYHAIFRIGYSAQGVLCGLFISPSQLATSATVALLSGGKNSMGLKYASGKDGNVISYSWNTNDGENGQGDNVRIELVNGQYQFNQFSVESETVTSWVLDQDKVQAAMNEAGTTDRQLALTLQVGRATKFADVKKYFRMVETSTAPNGYGYVVKAKMFGSIFAAPPVVISFDSGFPPALGTSQMDLVSQIPGVGSAIGKLGQAAQARKNTFYLRSATHQLSAAGYFTEIEVVDCFIMYGQVGLQ